MFRNGTAVVAVVSVLVCGCASTLAGQASNTGVPQNSPRPTIPILPTEFEVNDAIEMQRAAVRSAVELGFDIVLSDVTVGILKARRTEFDSEATQDLERTRQQIWNSFTPHQQLSILSKPDRANAFIGPGIIVMREFSFSFIVGPGRAVLTPSVVVCLQDGSTGVVRCGPPQQGLIASEAKIHSRLAGDIAFATDKESATKNTRQKTTPIPRPDQAETSDI